VGVIVCGSFDGRLIGKAEESEGEEYFCGFLAECRNEGGPFLFQEGREEGIEAVGFDADLWESGEGLPQLIFSGGDEAVLFGNFSEEADGFFDRAFSCGVIEVADFIFVEGIINPLDFGPRFFEGQRL